MASSSNLPSIVRSSSVQRHSSSAPNLHEYNHTALPALVTKLSSSESNTNYQREYNSNDLQVAVDAAADSEDAADNNAAAGLPDNWSHQRLISEGVENSKVGWENEIARHILSIYATKTALKNASESQSLLDFVGEKQLPADQHPLHAAYHAASHTSSIQEHHRGEYLQVEQKTGILYATPSFHRTAQEIFGPSAASSSSAAIVADNKAGKAGSSDGQQPMKHHKVIVLHGKSRANDDDSSSSDSSDNDDKAANKQEPDDQLGKTTASSKSVHFHIQKKEKKQQPRQQQQSAPYYEEYDQDAHQNEMADNKPTTKLKKKKKTKKVKRTKQKNAEASATVVATSSSNSSSNANNAFFASILQRIQTQQAASSSSSSQPQQPPSSASAPSSSSSLDSKYRITNTIRARNGCIITVRGSPKCYPIWFVSNGDVYCDWRSLPGGQRLQMHLSVLYEHAAYNEYLQIVETILIQLYRIQSLGPQANDEEAFSAHGFGLSERYPEAAANLAAGHTASSHNSRRNKQQSAKGDPLLFTQADRLQLQRQEQRRRSSQQQQQQSKQGKQAATAPSIFDEVWYEKLLQERVSSPLRRQAEARLTALQEELRIAYAAKASKEQLIQDEAMAYYYGQDDGQDEGYAAADYAQQMMMQQANDSSNQSQPNLTLAEIQALWKQLVLCALALAILCCEKPHRSQDAMNIFNQCEHWITRQECLAGLMPRKKDRQELKAYIKDAMAFYFFKKKRSLAALAYSQLSLELFEEVGNIDMIGVCHLHISAVYCQLSEFKDSHKALYQFLAMVETGRLAFQGATPKQLCLVAIAYHNLAVVQLKLAMPDLACKSSQNARKIARLCLSYSNRWINIFQYTHEVAIADMKYELSNQTVDTLTAQQKLLISELAEALFDPETATA